jgi:hypothetical protein
MPGYIGLPEIVEKEILKKVTRDGLDANERIKKDFDLVEQFTGSKRRYSLPTEDEFEKGVLDRLTDLNKLLIRVPFTFGQAQSALDRNISELPPKDYRDSAIWEAILDLSRTYEIYFVTRDKRFFKDQRPSRGLADNLLEDCVKDGGVILAFYDLAQCLKEIREQVPPIDPEMIAFAIDSSIREDLRKRAASKDFELGTMLGHKTDHFETENPDILSVRFALTYEMSDVSQEEAERAEASLLAGGDCSYDVDSETASDILFDTLEYRWQDLQGEIHKARDVFVRVHNTVVLSSVND